MKIQNEILEKLVQKFDPKELKEAIVNEHLAAVKQVNIKPCEREKAEFYVPALAVVKVKDKIDFCEIILDPKPENIHLNNCWADWVYRKKEDYLNEQFANMVDARILEKDDEKFRLNIDNKAEIDLLKNQPKFLRYRLPCFDKAYCHEEEYAQIELLKDKRKCFELYAILDKMENPD